MLQQLNRSIRSRPVRWSLGALVVFGALVAAGLRLWLDDTTTPVTVAAAISSFRQEQEAADPPPTPLRTLTPPGVYTYATEGSETIDALGGATHEYPKETTISARSTDCGANLVWAPLEERYEELELCWDGIELSLAGYVSFHRFFGQDDLQDFACEPPAVLLHPEPPSDEPPAGRCRTGALTELLRVDFLGVEALDVAGTDVEAAHIAIDIVLDSPDDATSGVGTADLWLAVDNGLVLRWRESMRSVAGSLVGDVTYTETFDLRLQSLDPAT